MDRYCGSTFWAIVNLNLNFQDVNVTWNTTNPDFTPCFENTVLLWSACAFLWIPAMFDVYMHANLNRSSSSWNLGWTRLGMFKMFNVMVLICSQVSMLCVNLYERVGDTSIPDMVWITPLLLIATRLLSGCLFIFHKNRRIHTSGYHLIHWINLSIVLAIMCRTKFIQYQNDLAKLATVALLLTDFSVMSLQSELFWKIFFFKTGKECPILRASCLSYILFSWCTPLVRKGYKSSLKADEMWDLIPSIRSRFVRSVFNRHYGRPHFGEIRSTYRNIIKPMWHTCGTAFYVAIIYGTANNLIVFLAPQLLGLMIDFVKDSTVELWKGYLWACSLLLIYVLMTVLLEQFYLNIFKCYFNIKTGLMLAIYQKSLKVSHAARKDKTTGEIVNLMSVDTEKIQLLAFDMNTIWAAPIQILVGVILLWRELGVAFLPGIGILCSIFPINWALSTVSAKYQCARMTKKDERIKIISEVLSGIQIVKLYAWEPSFQTEIRTVRLEEMQLLRKRMFIGCATEFIHNSVPFLVSLAAFFTYTYMSGDVVSPKKAFTVVTLFNILTGPIIDLPSCISSIVDAFVSFKRVNNFLNAEEVHPEAKIIQPRSAAHKPAIEIIDGNFAWEDLLTCNWKLSDINLKIKSGKLTAIVGRVASGKSSLLSAIIGDMKHSGEVIVCGRIAYAPQVPWILNTSLRENILFGLPYNKDIYDKIIDSCCLTADIEMLPGGDMTEIGEKGINLSGGQKQRLSLARLAYSGADILLMDDVLSAVDSHVAKCIFNELLGPKGLLAGKTRVFCSHAYNFLSQVDHIIVMESGKIEESTSYDDIKHSESRFSKLLSDLEQTSSKCESTDGDNEIGVSKIHSTKPEVNNQEAGMLIEEERLQTGDVRASVYFEFIRAMGYTLVVGIIQFFFFSEGLGIFRNIVLLEWTESGHNVSDTMLRHNYAIEYAIVGIIQSLCYLFGYVFLAISVLRAVTVIHNNMLHRILRAPMSFFNVTPLGRIVNRFSSDIEALDGNIQYQIGGWICHIFKLFGILITLIYTNKFILIFMVPLLMTYYILQRYYIVCMQQLQRFMNAHLSPIYSHFQETLNGTSTLRAYEAQERFADVLADKIDCYNRALYPHMIVRRWLSVRIGFLGSLIVFAPALFAVIWRETTDGALVALSISYALQVTDVLSWLVKITSYLQYSFVSAERVFEYSRVQQEADFDTKRNVVESNGDGGVRHSWPEKGIIVFNNYGTRYRPGLDLVLKQFSCQINSGEKIGIVGRTGAGKSSLTLGLFRIIESVSGDIIIDGINIAHIGLHDLRRRITVIPQDPVLFSRTLRMNLDPFDEHDDGKLWEAITLAHLGLYVEEQPDGLQLRISEGGENLSVGQRQLVCLARAILRKSSILVLDEATASVDSVTDALIQQTVREHFVGCTILNVAHRLKTVLDSSRIMVLNRGEIVEFDTPETLLADSDSYFYGMAKDAGLV
ncbi:hypothetical protein HA402_000529 [Bradysia odoriphaga]|nr:hypothetical protein HA402_000529 [Bradysia odoriphaga]